jgi:isoquinoline 1-oxidoreductase
LNQEAFECGAVVNPNGLRSQIEGAVVQAIGGVLFDAIEFEGGRILNPRFARYRVPRFTDLPEIEIVVLGTSPPREPARPRSSA